MSYKQIIPCIFIDQGRAVKWFDDKTVISDDVIALAKFYDEKGTNRSVWGKEDMESYQQYIVELLKEYLPETNQ